MPAGLIDLLNSRAGLPQLPKRTPDRINFQDSPCGGGGGGAAAAAGGRRLSQGWQVRQGVENYCDLADYFRWVLLNCLLG